MRKRAVSRQTARGASRSGWSSVSAGRARRLPVDRECCRPWLARVSTRSRSRRRRSVRTRGATARGVPHPAGSRARARALAGPGPRAADTVVQAQVYMPAVPLGVASRPRLRARPRHSHLHRRPARHRKVPAHKREPGQPGQLVAKVDALDRIPLVNAGLLERSAPPGRGLPPARPACTSGSSGGHHPSVVVPARERRLRTEGKPTASSLAYS